jgi:hypothetical protein
VRAVALTSPVASLRGGLRGGFALTTTSALCASFAFLGLAVVYAWACGFLLALALQYTAGICTTVCASRYGAVVVVITRVVVYGRASGRTVSIRFRSGAAARAFVSLWEHVRPEQVEVLHSSAAALEHAHRGEQDDANNMTPAGRGDLHRTLVHGSANPSR